MIFHSYIPSLFARPGSAARWGHCEWALYLVHHLGMIGMGDNRKETMASLVMLSRELGREDRRMAILGEGNASARLTDDTFLVKASGRRLGTLTEEDVVECSSALLLPLLEKPAHSDEEIEAALIASRVGGGTGKPSVESLFHAYCLTLPGVRFVGHTHAVAVTSILCSPRAREFAGGRLFPDEVVCCGRSSVFVPYTDPGYLLAREVRRRTDAFIRRANYVPRVILIENHGIITMGQSPEMAVAAMVMAEKAAAVWIGAASLGGPTVLSRKDVNRIATRADENYRQKALRI